jgi:hypothetical protein
LAEKSGYEKLDINVPFIIGIAALTIIVLIVIVVILNDYFTAEKEQMVYEVQLKPESTELRSIRALETETLNEYKVLDEKKGIYRIPVERAMKLIVDENFKQSLKSMNN